MIRLLARRLLRLWLLLLLVGITVTGCSAPGETGRYSLTVITQQDHVVAAGEVLVGNTVVGGGTVVVQEGAGHRGSMIVLAGKAQIGGQLQGDVTVLGGEAVFDRTAEVTGDLTVAGGAFTLHPAAVVRGKVTEESRPATVLQPRQEEASPLEQLLWSALVVVVMGGLAWVAAKILPRPMRRTAAAGTSFPVVSGALGALVLISALPLVVSMALTLFLIPVAGVVLLGLAASVVYGLLATGQGLGTRLVRRLGWNWSAPSAAALGTAVSVAALQLLALVPVLGPAAIILTVVVVVGAVFLTGFGLRQYIPPDDADDDPGMLQ